MSEPILLIATVTIRPEQEQAFIAWQVQYEAALAKCPGFISTDIVPVDDATSGKWTIVLNFDAKENLVAWQQSAERRQLVEEVSAFAVKSDFGPVIPEETKHPQPIITEVILSKIRSGKEEAYRSWTVRVQMAQAKYPGYRGMYLQPPEHGPGGYWTTLLRYDTMEHLWAWKNSSERAALLQEASDIIESVEFMRLATSFPGWVPIDPVTGKGPPNWKTAMLILLGLYPMVVLEMCFVSPHLSFLNRALAVFVTTFVTVALTTFLSMPWFVRWFGWWLFADPHIDNRRNRLGLGILIGLYLLEIGLLWQLFPL